MAALRSRLAGRPPRRAFRLLSPRRAAVSVVLDPGGAVLLARRASRAGDPWSGQVSLPGGMAQAGDGSLLGTALRETREEVGVDLAGAPVLGALDEVGARPRSGLRPLAVSPFVFALPARPEARAGPELARVFWLPLGDAAQGSLDSRMRLAVLGLTLSLACWRCQGEVVWGLTYCVLRGLVALGSPSGPARA